MPQVPDERRKRAKGQQLQPSTNQHGAGRPAQAALRVDGNGRASVAIDALKRKNNVCEANYRDLFS